MNDRSARLGAGENLRRIVLAALVLPAAMAVAACGTASVGSGAPTTSPTSSAASASPSDVTGSASPSVSAAASPSAEDPCSLITADEVEALVGSAVSPTPADTPAGPTCRWVPSGAQGFLTLAVFTSDVEQTLTDAIGNFGLGEVPGVGSTAAGVDGTIYVSTGTLGFSIVATNGTFQPIPLADLTTLAQTVVERLGGSNAAPSPSESASPSPSAS
jgi:hypothetical protein